MYIYWVFLNYANVTLDDVVDPMSLFNCGKDLGVSNVAHISLEIHADKRYDGFARKMRWKRTYRRHMTSM